MPLLPYLGDTTDTKHWSSDQKLYYAICTYLIILMFIIATILAFSNIIRFIKASMACPHPLLFFYAWIILDMLSNIVWLVFSVWATNEDSELPMVLFLPATMRVVLGIEQIWLMVELIERIDSSTKMLETNDSFGL